MSILSASFSKEDVDYSWAILCILHAFYNFLQMYDLFFLLRCLAEMLAGGSLCLYSMVNQRLVAVFVVSTIKNG